MGGAQFALFQVITGANWHYIMYAAIEHDGFWTCLYFVVFYFTAVMLLVNLMISLFLEIFMGERDVRLKGRELVNVLAKADNGPNDMDLNALCDDAETEARTRGSVRSSRAISSRSTSSIIRMESPGLRTSSVEYFGGINDDANLIVVSESSSIHRMHRRLRKQYYGSQKENLINRRRVYS